MYETGNGCLKSLQDAFHYYSLAASQKNPIGNYKLGNIYFKGLGVEKDNHLAIRYFMVAAEQGNASAQCQLGLIYDAGLGVLVHAFILPPSDSASKT